MKKMMMLMMAALFIMSCGGANSGAKQESVEQEDTVTVTESADEAVQDTLTVEEINDAVDKVKE